MTNPKSIFRRLLRAFAGFVRPWETTNPMPRGQIVQWVIVMWIAVVAFDILILVDGCGQRHHLWSAKNNVVIAIVVPAIAAVITVFKWPRMTKKE